MYYLTKKEQICMYKNEETRRVHYLYRQRTKGKEHTSWSVQKKKKKQQRRGLPQPSRSPLRPVWLASREPDPNLGSMGSAPTSSRLPTPQSALALSSEGWLRGSSSSGKNASKIIAHPILRAWLRATGLGSRFLNSTTRKCASNASKFS